jgi:hypothetical protein
MFPIHSGIGGTVNVPMDLTQAAISSALSIMVNMARENGMTKTRSSMTVITTTARPRLCQSHACILSRSGHVATTMMVAQIKEVRKGFMTQKLAAMSVPMNRTDSVMRVTSREADTFVFLIGFLPSLYPHNHGTERSISESLSFQIRLIKEFISKESLLKNLPFPLFAKEGCISSLWQREVRRDFIINVFILMTVLVTPEILHFILFVYYAHVILVEQVPSLLVGEE